MYLEKLDQPPEQRESDSGKYRNAPEEDHESDSNLFRNLQERLCTFDRTLVLRASPRESSFDAGRGSERVMSRLGKGWIGECSESLHVGECRMVSDLKG